MKKLYSLLFTLALTCTQVAHADLKLEDLNFNQDQIKVDPKFNQVMEERQHKLQTHQKLGLVTAAAMTTTLLLAGSAKSNNAHKYAGIATGALYWTTAYFSLSAPKPEGIKESGSSKIHEALAWVHAPLMAIVPVLGYIRKEDINKGKSSNSIVKNHGGLATAAYISFMSAAAVMYFDF